MIGEAFEKFEQKTFGNEKNDLKQHKRFKPLHAKPQNSSKERGSVQYTGKSLLMLHIPHTMVNAKCTYRIYGIYTNWNDWILFENAGNPETTASMN